MYGKFEKGRVSHPTKSLAQIRDWKEKQVYDMYPESWTH